jgi:DNA polymerase-3 subunit delta'
MNRLYPWQQAQWQRLQESRRQGRLPHALLLTGPQGLGKAHFADLFAQSLLCEAPQGEQGLPCGECRYCRLYRAGTHPDVSQVAPLEGKKGIGVDQVRAMGQFMALKSQYAGHKVVVIAPAEAMNINASNSLLKTLEEPTPGTVLLLATHLPAQLPATIRSRCQEIRFTPGDGSAARDWLQQQQPEEKEIDLLLALADGAPLKAQALAQGGLLEQRRSLFDNLDKLSRGRLDPIMLAGQCIKADPAWSLNCLHGWTVDMIRLASATQAPHLANPDLQERMLKLMNQVSLTDIYKLQDRIKQALQELERNFNPTLILESVLLLWQGCFRSAGRKIA